MGKHNQHNMRWNSLEAHQVEKQKFPSRKEKIISFLYKHGRSTERQIMLGLGFTDMNSIRPRVTEMINSGELKELGTSVNPVTKRKCRIVNIL